jgi:acetylornithine deacetylase/succinyl-diaminopimelate desuccinylase-like protein
MAAASAYQDLSHYVAIPSVAGTLAARQAAQWLAKYLHPLAAQIDMIGDHHSVIVATIAGKTDQCLAYYGHYDVQSASQSGWTTDPFVPTIIDERMYGRGASDNKGQYLALLAAIKQLAENGERPHHTVKLVIEGEEEIGSPQLIKLCQHQSPVLRADDYLIVDGTSMMEQGPTIYTETRGVVFSQIRLSNGCGDQHSGTFSQNVNPTHALATIIADLEKDAPSIIPELQKGQSDQLPWSFDTCYVRAGKDPAKSIIPGSVEAVLSIRLQPGQSARLVSEQLRAYVKQCGDDRHLATEYELKVLAEPTQSHNPELLKQLRKVCQWQNVAHQVGSLRSSIPIASVIQQMYGKDPLILAWGSARDNPHGCNESFSLVSFQQSQQLFRQILRTI